MRERHDDVRYHTDDPPLIVVISETTPTATKEHTCQACLLPITAGTKHRRYFYRDDDQRDPKTGKSKTFAARVHFICPELTQ